MAMILIQIDIKIVIYCQEQKKTLNKLERGIKNYYSLLNVDSFIFLLLKIPGVQQLLKDYKYLIDVVMLINNYLIHFN